MNKYLIKLAELKKISAEGGQVIHKDQKREQDRKTKEGYADKNHVAKDVEPEESEEE